jgi:chorismate dehydratase
MADDKFRVQLLSFDVMSQKKKRPCIAASSYLNTAPLIWSFLRGSHRGRVEMLLDKAPARSAEVLANNEADVSLIPVIEAQRVPNLVFVSNACVASHEKVRSVVLVTRGKELKDVRSVALDTSSRTSAALVQIIFREFIGHEPECKPVAPDLNLMLEKNDAALMIGDPAMIFSHDGLIVYDMATLWRKYTGLGFVFALWAVRENSIDIAKQIDFNGARDEGLNAAEEIIAEYSDSLGLPVESLREYVYENISFRLDDELIAGLNLYFELAFKHGLIQELKKLRMI